MDKEEQLLKKIYVIGMQTVHYPDNGLKKIMSLLHKYYGEKEVKKMDKQLIVAITGTLSFFTLFACSGIYFLDRELWVLIVGIIAFIVWVMMMVIDNKFKTKSLGG